LEKLKLISSDEYFDTQQGVNNLGLSGHTRETIPLVIEGNLYRELGGIPTQGQEYVRIIKPR